MYRYEVIESKTDTKETIQETLDEMAANGWRLKETELVDSIDRYGTYTWDIKVRRFIFEKGFEVQCNCKVEIPDWVGCDIE